MEEQKEQQPAQQEEKVTQQPTDEHQDSEEWVNGIVRRQQILEIGIIIAIVLTVAAAIGWLINGEYMKAINNVLWIYIGGMYWRFQKIARKVGFIALELLAKNGNMSKQIDAYKLIEENQKKMISVQDDRYNVRTEQVDQFKKMVELYEKIGRNNDLQIRTWQHVAQKRVIDPVWHQADVEPKGADGQLYLVKTNVADMPAYLCFYNQGAARPFVVPSNTLNQPLAFAIDEVEGWCKLEDIYPNFINS